MSEVGWLRRLAAWLGAGAARGPEPRPQEDPGIERDAAGDGEPVQMPVEDAIDLHTFHPRDVASVTEEYLHEAQRLGFREVRIIHGRGKGVQRGVVRRVLARHPAVASFGDAPATRGGWGATLVALVVAGSPRGRRRSPGRR